MDRSAPDWSDQSGERVQVTSRLLAIRLGRGDRLALPALAPHGLAGAHLLTRFVRFHQQAAYLAPGELGRLMSGFLLCERDIALTEPYARPVLSLEAARPVPAAVPRALATFAGSYVYARGLQGEGGRALAVQAHKEVLQALGAWRAQGVIRKEPHGLLQAIEFALSMAGRSELPARRPGSSERAQQRLNVLIECFAACQLTWARLTPPPSQRVVQAAPVPPDASAPHLRSASVPPLQGDHGTPASTSSRSG